MTTASDRFRFWTVTVAALLTAALTASLGVWQLSRAAQKQAMQARVEQQARLPAWDTATLLAAQHPDEALYRPVSLDGHWVAGSSVFLENRQMNSRNGFFLITALRLSGSERAVLVQRGWVPRDFTDRTHLPEIATTTEAVHIQGRLAAAPGRLFQLGEAGTGSIRQNIDIAAYAQETGMALLPFSVLQIDPPSDGLLRDWSPITFDVSRHYGYAFQWFALCALVAFLYVWFQIISPRRKRTVHGLHPR
ncbi:SURF1 family protein [Hydrogenophaga sp.]|uniref:SURF1 family protein n=1 Tax=Hydrogenophaga sp. TaxID=1904254 RepID=UPI003562CB92